MTNFDVAFNYLVLVDEGSTYTNDPKDSGGPTRWGVTKKVYQEFFGFDHVDDSEIAMMRADAAKRIYHTNYWSPLGCGKILDLAFAIAIFDCGVLYGIGTIANIVQRHLVSCGAALKSDGVLGDKSIASLNTLLGGGSQDARVSHMQAFRGLLSEHIDAVIAANPKDERFRRGWALRADRLLKLVDDEYINQFKQELY